MSTPVWLCVFILRVFVLHIRNYSKYCNNPQSKQHVHVRVEVHLAASWRVLGGLLKMVWKRLGAYGRFLARLEGVLGESGFSSRAKAYEHREFFSLCPKWFRLYPKWSRVGPKWSRPFLWEITYKTCFHREWTSSAKANEHREFFSLCPKWSR